MARTLSAASATAKTTPTLTLRHFLLKAQVFALYRSAIRASQHVPDETARRDTVRWIRSEIERNRHVHDIEKIQWLVRSARRDFAQILPSMRSGGAAAA